MPEIGLEDEPISPVKRDETVTNKKPKMTMSIAPRMFMCSVGTAMMPDDQNDHARCPTNAHRQVAVGTRGDRRILPQPSFRPSQTHVAQSGAEAMPDSRKRSCEADEAAGRYRARADVEDIFAADVAGTTSR